jgi:hypothetical protein
MLDESNSSIIEEIDWDKESVGQVQTEKILHEGFVKAMRRRIFPIA